MNTKKIIGKFYQQDTPLYNILTTHSLAVTQKALAIAHKHPNLQADTQFIEEAAMIHDIGIFLTNAPSIQCFGTAPYLCHGYLGSNLLKELGYPRHALVCERHTGTGITLDQIISQNLPLPHRPMCPESIEEKIICFADCFYSKTHLKQEKTIEQVKQSLQKYGPHSVNQFTQWCSMFL